MRLLREVEFLKDKQVREQSGLTPRRLSNREKGQSKLRQRIQAVPK